MLIEQHLRVLSSVLPYQEGRTTRRDIAVKPFRRGAAYDRQPLRTSVGIIPPVQEETPYFLPGAVPSKQVVPLAAAMTVMRSSVALRSTILMGGER